MGRGFGGRGFGGGQTEGQTEGSRRRTEREFETKKTIDGWHLEGRALRPHQVGRHGGARVCEDHRCCSFLARARRLPRSPRPAAQAGLQLPRGDKMRPAFRLGHRGSCGQRVQDRCFLPVAQRGRDYWHGGSYEVLLRLFPCDAGGGQPLLAGHGIEVSAHRPRARARLQGRAGAVLHRLGHELCSAREQRPSQDHVVLEGPHAGSAEARGRQKCEQVRGYAGAFRAGP
mmetsp:Transcript_39372/g.104048  ORF Transcript_39372/g.104048 Transcript_39372/m.104048 type:complete len:229 (+) Transcript_39372:94-780(+)